MQVNLSNTGLGVCYILYIIVNISKLFLDTDTLAMIDGFSNGPCLVGSWLKMINVISLWGYNSRLMAVKGLHTSLEICNQSVPFRQCKGVNKWHLFFGRLVHCCDVNVFSAPSGKSPYLMFTNRHEIRRIDLLKSEYTQVVPTLKNAVALDVDVSINKMFWCDLYHRKIYRYTQHTQTYTDTPLTLHYDLFSI